MNTPPLRTIAGVVGLLASAVCALLTAVTNRAAGWRDFIFIIPIGLVVGCVMWIALNAPAYLHEAQVHVTDTALLRLKAHQYNQERGAKWQPAAGRVIDAPLSDHDRAWRHWLIRCAAESKRLGTIKYSSTPTKPGMKEFFGGDAEKWQMWIDLLAAWGKCWPRVPSQETFLKPGITPTLIFDLLVGGQLPPALPAGYPPSLNPRQREDSSTPENDEETAVNGGETGSTVYASELRR